MKLIKIEMIHDIVCSWCVIGNQYLTNAIMDLGLRDLVEITYLPHQLNPAMGPDGMDIREYFKVYHGWSDTKHNDYRERLAQTAKKAGVNIDFRYRTRYFNTDLAHRLMAEAQAEGLARMLHESLLTAYHAKGVNISNRDELLKIGTDAGLSASTCMRALDAKQPSALYLEAVKRRALFKTPSVPAWIVNGNDLIVGSQSQKYFHKLLQELTTNPKIGAQTNAIH